jgi:probable HAF family extracellular repeat protein
MTDLGTLGGSGSSFAGGINDLGEIVGTTFDGEGRQRAFIWTADQGMRDLGGFTENTSAHRINNSGTVIGLSSLENGLSIGTLWPGR